ncbi:MAG: topoisomerase DNA-binding C4 zinc finger domain-containing protein [Eubacterium sp.]|nr:topoisomerase DNA-binding C4 zinc finger domain-containing protein [Eubacterium sp.]
MVATPETESRRMFVRYAASICPECGGELREKSGQYGKFMGCSNYPRCRYTRKIRNGGGRL